MSTLLLLPGRLAGVWNPVSGRLRVRGPGCTRVRRPNFDCKGIFRSAGPRPRLRTKRGCDETRERSCLPQSRGCLDPVTDRARTPAERCDGVKARPSRPAVAYPNQPCGHTAATQTCSLLRIFRAALYPGSGGGRGAIRREGTGAKAWAGETSMYMRRGLEVTDRGRAACLVSAPRSHLGQDLGQLEGAGPQRPQAHPTSGLFTGFSGSRRGGSNS
jgi:hypothetical protein